MLGSNSQSNTKPIPRHLTKQPCLLKASKLYSGECVLQGKGVGSGRGGAADRGGQICLFQSQEHGENTCSPLQAQVEDAGSPDPCWSSHLTICQTVSRCQGCSSRNPNMTCRHHSLLGNHLTLLMKALGFLHSRAEPWPVLCTHRWAGAVAPSLPSQHTLSCSS